MQGPKLVGDEFQVMPQTDFTLDPGWEMELMKLEVLIAGAVCIWRALVGERLMSSRIISESKTQCLCSALICRER